MDLKTKEIYSEVYEILILLGDSFINRLPKELFDIVKREKSNSYKPKYDISCCLETQNIQRQSIAMLALFYLNYWCESEEEKNMLRKIFKDNEIKYQEELKGKYNCDNIFKKK